MTQAELNHAVAQATGETVCTISELGFSIVDPDLLDYDSEPFDIEDHVVDWDEADCRRNTPVVAT